MAYKMKMKLEMDKMTEHDKNLLVVLTMVILVVVLGGFVLRPLIMDNIILKEEVAAAQETKESCEQKIALLEPQKEISAKLFENRALAAEGLYPWMDSPEIDRMLTSFVVSRGMNARDLSIVMPSEMTDIAPYSSGDTETAGHEADTCSGVYAASVSMTISGQESGLRQMIDDIYANYPAIRITSYSWSTATVVGKVNADLTADAAPIAEDDHSVMLMLNLEIYMINDDLPATVPDSKGTSETAAA